MVLGDVAVAAAAFAGQQAVPQARVRRGSRGVDRLALLGLRQVAVAAMLALRLRLKLVLIPSASGVDKLLAGAGLVVKVPAWKVFLAVAFRFLHEAGVYNHKK